MKLLRKLIMSLIFNRWNLFKTKNVIILSHRAARTFLKWMYKDATIYLERKYEKYLGLIEYENELIQKKQLKNKKSLYE